MKPAFGLGLSLLLICSVANALPEDRSLPIKIDANRAILSEREGTTIYIGNVILVQGTLTMHADRLEIFTINKEVDRVIAYGKPAKVVDQPDPEKAPIKARAETIRYFMKKEKLELETNASIDQDGSSITSDSIHYFVNDQVVKANSNNQEGRVKMVIPPRTEQP
jgi:lipopolysaccharide export system protein LptA